MMVHTDRFWLLPHIHACRRPSKHDHFVQKHIPVGLLQRHPHHGVLFPSSPDRFDGIVVAIRIMVGILIQSLFTLLLTSP